MKLIKLTLPILVSLSSGVIAQAEDQDCPSKAVFQFRAQNDISSMIHNTLSIEGSPRSRTNEYARENKMTMAQMDANFGATGEMDCRPKHSGSASVVGKRDLVVTSAHAFWDPDTCLPIIKPEDCTFNTAVAGKKVARKIKGLISDGLKCSPGRKPNPEDDWAIVVLEEEVPQAIKPYSVGDAAKMKTGDRVLAVNGQNADFFEPDPQTNKLTWAKSFAPCFWGEPTNRLISTNCSSAGKSSGSSLLNSNGELVGLLASGTETREELMNALTTKPFKANSCKYDRLKCSTYYVPIEGDFKKALESAVNGRDI